MDQYAAFRDIWTVFTAQLPKYWLHCHDLCGDEQLVDFRCRGSLGQHISFLNKQMWHKHLFA